MTRLRASVSDGKGRAIARLERRCERYVELAVAGCKLLRAPLARDAANFEIDGVEREPLDRLVERADGRRTDAVERLGGDVRRKIEIDVFDGDDFVGSVL